MRHAVIVNETVHNVVLAEPETAAENGWVECPDWVHIGDAYDGTDFIPYVEPLEERQARMRAHVNHRRDTLQDGTVTTPFGRFDCNERSRVFISGGVTEAMIRQQLGDTTPLTFTTADNVDVALSPEHMIGAGRLVLGYISAVHFFARGLKDAIEAAQTHGELDAIDMEAGWP